MTDDHAVAAAPQPSTGRLPRLVALGAAFVLSAVGAGTAVGYFGLRDHTTARPTARAAATPAKPGYGAHSDGDHFGSLSDLLLPVPDGYGYGPDDGGDGDNTVLTHDQYLKTFNKDFADLGTSERRQLANQLDLDHVLGYAVRTYTDNAQLVIKVSLLQENQQTAKGMASLGKYIADQTGAFRAGPTITGHPEAHCYLLATDPNDPLDRLDCDDYVGDILITVQAYGPAPLDQQAVASLMEQQLSRLAIPAAQI
ncbi:hypothetical protein [Streptacidiphilus anmyonensis]|uniref:hypothetical protein n=1 Tax=Streptacidiphilus anmyonensis TaxID=405782 RepID=UPI0005A63A0A|nr:hypothetical protein [Streptacidiphilus anmyonensis]